MTLPPRPGRTPVATLVGMLVAVLVASLALSPAFMARAADPVVLDPLEDATQLVTGVIPRDWRAQGNGIYARQATPDDQVIVAVQSSPASTATVWSSLLPQLGLSIAPDPIGTRATTALRWKLYEVRVSSVDPPLHVDLGVAAADGRTYLILLVALADEAASLHDSVFLPMIDALAPLAAAPTPSPGDLPYTLEEVAFSGGAPSIVLSGTLTRPIVSRLTAGVVLLSGSGPQDRDESLAPLAAMKPFALIADALTRAGIAVLRFDDRGVGKSTGDYAKATIGDLTADAVAAVAYLASRPDMDLRHIGVLGHSLGGIEAAALGARDAQVAFVVGMAAPAVDGVSLLVAQNIAVSESAGISADVVTAASPTIRAMYEAVLVGDGARAEAALRTLLGLTYDALPAGTRSQLGDREAWIGSQVGPQLAVLQSTELRSILASDPASDWVQVRVPVLGLYGGKDVQVVAAQSAPSLTAALEVAGNADYQVVTLPDANHLFQPAVSGAVTEYGTLPQTFTADFLPTLVEWVTQHAATTP